MGAILLSKLGVCQTCTNMHIKAKSAVPASTELQGSGHSDFETAMQYYLLAKCSGRVCLLVELFLPRAVYMQSEAEMLVHIY